MDITIRKLSPEVIEDYFDFFDHRAFTDGSPFAPCYCNLYNMSKSEINDGLFQKAQAYGGWMDGYQKAAREVAWQMVLEGRIQGYLAFDDGISVGWCNANDKRSFYRVGEFDLRNIPDDASPDTLPKTGEVKSVICFEIAPTHRGMGIATLLLQRVCEDARKEGYRFVEAYPQASREHTALAFTGPIRLYEKAGFIEAEQRGSVLVMKKCLGD